jgi:hypothetical protein
MPRNLIPLPARVVDETGHRYGRLKVLEYAGLLDGKAAWHCACECNGETGYPGKATARGDKLRTKRIVSCGCWTADPDVRQAARMKTPAKERKAIARLGAAASAIARAVPPA